MTQPAPQLLAQITQTSSQPPSTPISVPISVSPALLQFAGSGLVLLLAAGLSHWQNRRWKATASKGRSPASALLQIDQLHLDRLHLKQPLQWINYGKQLEGLGDYRAAVALYDRALQQYPADFRLWHERGLALAKLQQFEAAIESYDRAYQIQPQQRDLAHERGDALLQLGRYSEAIDSFDIFLQYAPNNGHVLADRGYALMQLGCYHEALKSIEAALKQHWEPAVMIQARHYQIETLHRSGQLKAALAVAEAAVRQYPKAGFGAQYAALKQLQD